MADYDHEISTNITLRWKEIVGAIKAKLVAAVLYGTSTVTGDTPVKVDSDGHIQVDALSSALPTGAATAALQGAGLPAALGTGLGLKSEGVGVAGTPAGGVASVQGVAGGTAQPVSGTVTANQGTAGATGWPTTDGGPSWTSVWGVAGVPVTSADMSAAAVAVTDAPTAGQKLVIDDIAISSDTALRFTLTEETSGTVRAYARCPAGSTVPLTWRGKMKLATADKRLLCQSSAAGNVEVLIGYHSEA